MKKFLKTALSGAVAFAMLFTNTALEFSSVTVTKAENPVLYFPVHGGTIGYAWGYPEGYDGFHNGLDITPNGDDTIYAAQGGRVIAVNNLCPHFSIYPVQCEHYGTYGNSVYIEDDYGIIHLYGHLQQNSIRVNVGDYVSIEQPIATMGSSGYSTGIHLHYGVQVNGYSANNTPGVEFNYYYEPGPPKNISISADKTTVVAGDTVAFKYNIDSADSKGIGIDKNGKRYDTVSVSANSGTVKYTFKEAGTYCVITEGSNSAGYKCCDGVWISVVSPPVLKEGAGQTLPDGTYWIASKINSNYFVDLPGEEIIPDEGCNVSMWNFGDNAADLTKYEAFDITYLGGDKGFYKIVQHGGNAAVDVYNKGVTSGTNIGTFQYRDSSYNQWSVIRTSGGYKIQSRWNELYWDVTGASQKNGTNLELFTGNDSAAQYFTFIPYMEQKDEVISNGIYSLKSAYDGEWYAGVDGSASSYKTDSLLKLTSECKDSFIFEPDGKGYYRIQEESSGLYLAARDSDSFFDRMSVVLAEKSSKLSCQWAVKEYKTGTYLLVNRLNGYVLNANEDKEGFTLNLIPLNTASDIRHRWEITPVKELTDLVMSSAPSKKQYYEYEKLDTTGVKITAVYDDGTSKDVTSYAKFSYDFSEAGEKEVTVSYTFAGVTKNVSYTADVSELSLLFKGSGTENKPYLINSKDALVQMRDLVNNEHYNPEFGSAYYALISDIDLSDIIWTGIGSNNQPFLGSFDGRKYKITNMTVKETKKFAGFFGKVNGSAEISNLSVEGSVSNTNRSTGGIAGEIGNSEDGPLVTIRNCSFTGNVSGDLAGAGGIAGCIWQSGIITDCYHVGTVSTKEGFAGGIAGYISTGEFKNAAVSIANSYHAGKITGDGGTIAGKTEGNKVNDCKIILKNCYALTSEGKYALTPDSDTMEVKSLSSDSLLNSSAGKISEIMTENTKQSGLNTSYPVFWWQNITKGDVNGDGIIDASDSKMAIEIFQTGGKGFTRENIYAADVDDDGIVNAIDASVITALYQTRPGDSDNTGTDTEPPVTEPPADEPDITEPPAEEPPANSNSGSLGKHITYSIDDNAVMTVSGEGAIPDYDENSSPFTDRKDIKKVIFSEGITDIGDFLFYQNRSVQEIILPSTLKSIGKSSFSQCYKIEKADIPESVKEIETGAFQACPSLKSVVLRDGLESIGGWVFENCSSLTSIIIPDSVNSVGEMVFSNCNSLKEISVPSTFNVQTFYIDNAGDFPVGTVITVRKALTEVADLSGDADGNGVLNSKDLICIAESIISGNPPKSKEDADIDKDNIIGVSDLILLKKKLMK